MSLNGAPKQGQELSREEQLEAIDVQIDEAQMTFQDDLVEKLQKERVALLEAHGGEDKIADPRPSEDLDRRYDVEGHENQSPDQQTVVSIEDGVSEPELGEVLAKLLQERRSNESEEVVSRLNVEYQKQLLIFENLDARYESLEQETVNHQRGLPPWPSAAYTEAVESEDYKRTLESLLVARDEVSNQMTKLGKVLSDVRGMQLGDIQKKVYKKAPLTKEDLQSLYFERNFLHRDNGIIDLLHDRHETPLRNRGFDQDGDYKKLREVGFGDLTTLFDCASRQIAINLLDVVIYKSEIKVFVGNPSYEMVSLLERQPELQTSIRFFREFPGATFPVKEMTLEEMKKIVGKE